jgi:hypothetical protein
VRSSACAGRTRSHRSKATTRLRRSELSLRATFSDCLQTALVLYTPHVIPPCASVRLSIAVARDRELEARARHPLQLLPRSLSSRPPRAPFCWRVCPPRTLPLDPHSLRTPRPMPRF